MARILTALAFVLVSITASAQPAPFPTPVEGDFVARTRIDEWEFFRKEWWNPVVIDMPVLSAKERLAVEPALHGPPGRKLEDILGFAIEGGDLATGEDSLESLKRFYRLYPQFGRIVF